MSKKGNKKDDQLEKILLLTAVISLLEVIIELIVELLKLLSAN